MTRFSARLGLALLAMMGVGAPVAVHAAPLVYEYQIRHPTYGNIGTYVNIIDRTGDSIRVTTSVHVKVRILGMVAYREDAERTEQWQGGRLVSFHGVTTKNGKHYEVSGEARDQTFVVT